MQVQTTTCIQHSKLTPKDLQIYFRIFVPFGMKLFAKKSNHKSSELFHFFGVFISLDLDHKFLQEFLAYLLCSNIEK